MRFPCAVVLILGACRPEAEPVGMLHADPARVDLAAALPHDGRVGSLVTLANVGLACAVIDGIEVEGDEAVRLSLDAPETPLMLAPSDVVHFEVVPQGLPFPTGLADALVVVEGSPGEDVDGDCVLADDVKPIEIGVPIVLATPYACDGDGDGALIVGCGGDDCDDADPAVFPGADEVCNGIDDDCDTVVDGPAAIDARDWYADTDMDGFGDAAVSAHDCVAPLGYVGDATDCDDADDAIHPAAAEVCDGLDQDCDLDVDEGFSRFGFHVDADADQYGDPAQMIRACALPPGTVPNGNDCDDTDPLVHPGADEVCDDADQDCDLVADDNAVDATPWHRDADLDGYGSPIDVITACDAPSGYVFRGRDCNDADPSIHPDADEFCDGIDQDCDDTPDDDPVDGDAYYPDIDGDLYGDDDAVVMSCTPIPGSIADGGDCDDTDPGINPAATETCDAVDQDCDGQIDQGANVCACPILQFGGHAYGICDLQVPFNFANTACGLSSYQLASIQDASEDAFVVLATQAVRPGPWWIGYTDQSVEGTFEWTDGSPPDYERWVTGAPQGGINAADCVQIGVPGWDDVGCFNTRSFVCEAGP